ncbi:hypothetical protein [Rhodococcus chondri]|uniref:Uncharacterized protein n=1 Tax=Rhodococcus chondri TaxID=3065941 RepID=A0ABU7JTK1_9NOCA|nr:hypothetical protein [Rhodococcus sp. CC-R104]MEE2033353.1 hypothetical protein [Rhodococcus sp. CC-R104]
MPVPAIADAVHRVDHRIGPLSLEIVRDPRDNDQFCVGQAGDEYGWLPMTRSAGRSAVPVVLSDSGGRLMESLRREMQRALREVVQPQPDDDGTAENPTQRSRARTYRNGKKGKKRR